MLIIPVHNFILLQFHLVPTLNAIYVCMYVCLFLYTNRHTNNARRTRAIKSRIAMVKTAFTKKKFHFTSNLNLDLRGKLVKLLQLEHSFVWC